MANAEYNGTKENETVLFLTDYQVPYDDPRVHAIAMEWIKDNDPDLIVLGGDIIDMPQLSIKYARNIKERHSWVGDLVKGRDIIADIDSVRRDTSRMAFIDGNHEERLVNYLSTQAPELEELAYPSAVGSPLSIASLLAFSPKMIHVAGYGNVLDYRGFTFKHGDFHGGTAGKRELVREGGSGIAGHLHQLRVYAETNRRGSHAWYHSPAMCHVRGDNLPPGAHHGLQDWTQGFTILRFYGKADKRVFNVYPMVVTRGCGY